MPIDNVCWRSHYEATHLLRARNQTEFYQSRPFASLPNLWQSGFEAWSLQDKIRCSFFRLPFQRQRSENGAGPALIYGETRDGNSTLPCKKEAKQSKKQARSIPTEKERKQRYLVVCEDCLFSLYNWIYINSHYRNYDPLQCVHLGTIEARPRKHPSFGYLTRNRK